MQQKESLPWGVQSPRGQSNREANNLNEQSHLQWWREGLSSAGSKEEVVHLPPLFLLWK